MDTCKHINLKMCAVIYAEQLAIGTMINIECVESKLWTNKSTESKMETILIGRQRYREYQYTALSSLSSVWVIMC